MNCECKEKEFALDQKKDTKMFIRNKRIECHVQWIYEVISKPEWESRIGDTKMLIETIEVAIVNVV